MNSPILIAHKGNILKRDIDRENTIEYIEHALRKGYSVEIEVYLQDNDFLTLSDDPDDVIDESFLENPKIYVNCVNEACYEKLKNNLNIRCFYIYDDDEAYVSNCGETVIRNALGNKMVSKNRIVMFPGTYDEFKLQYKTGIVPFGICTDHPESFKVGFEKEFGSFTEKVPERVSLTQFVRDIQSRDWRTA